MAIEAYIGKPGEGKTYSLVAWLLTENRNGRRKGISQFAVDGMRQLHQLTDLLHEDAWGAAVALDEIGRILPSRDWSREDDVESLVLETHRHHGLDIRYAAQSISQVSKGLRNLTSRYHYVFRIGPDPSRRLILGTGKTHWWNRPWAIRIVSYDSDELNDEGKPTSDAKPQVKYKLFWPWVASQYDTSERIRTEGLDEEVTARLEGARERLALQWRVVDGRVPEGTATRFIRARDNEVLRERKKRRAGY